MNTCSASRSSSPSDAMAAGAAQFSRSHRDVNKANDRVPAGAKIPALSCSVSDSRGNPARATRRRDGDHSSALHALGVWKVRSSRLWIWGLNRADAGLRAQLIAPSRGTNHLSAGCDAVRFVPASDMNAGRCQFQPTAAEVSSPGVSPQQWQGGRFAKVCVRLPQDTRCPLPSVVLFDHSNPYAMT